MLLIPADPLERRLRIPRDIRDDRQWDRVWRDPPGGYFWCCPCGFCCDNTNACANVQFSDNFSSSLPGYTDVGCGAGSVNYGVSGGFLQETFGTPTFAGGGGAHTQIVPIPPLNGLCLSVSANIYAITGKTTGTTGVTIGGIGSLLGNFASPVPPATPYGTWNKATAAGCPDNTGTLHSFGTANTSFNNGDCLCLVLQDTSGGTGTYSLKSYVNGSLLDTFAGLTYSLTPSTNIKVGVVDTNGGKWANLCVASNSSIPCCPNQVFPPTLHITFSNSGHCAALDGKTFALVYGSHSTSPNTWSADLTCGAGNTLEIIFGCRVSPPGTSCSNFFLAMAAVAGAPQCIISSVNPTSCTCSPINAVFSVTVNNAGGPCQCCTGGTVLTATVTL